MGVEFAAYSAQYPQSGWRDDPRLVWPATASKLTESSDQSPAAIDYLRLRVTPFRHEGAELLASIICSRVLGIEALQRNGVQIAF